MKRNRNEYTDCDKIDPVRENDIVVGEIKAKSDVRRRRSQRLNNVDIKLGSLKGKTHVRSPNTVNTPISQESTNPNILNVSILS